MEEEELPRSNTPKGGLTAMPFIFSTEIAEKLGLVGFFANMTMYLTTELNMPITKAANTLTNFGGAASLSPLIGAFIADSYAGRFWTITFASLISLLGMIVLTISACLTRLRPAPCRGGQLCQDADGGQLGIFYLSMILCAIGSGGIRPCVVPFGADQFDDSDINKYRYFNFYYFAMGCSILLAVTVLVYIQNNVSWGLGLGISTFIMFFSVVSFVFGYPFYRHFDPVGSPFTRLAQIIVAACRKRKVPMVSDASLLYQNEELDAEISRTRRLLHTNQLQFLDKAAIIVEEDDVRNPWKLSTVHRVEELKSLVRMIPIWASGILLITAYAQQGTFSQQQAKTMNRHIGKSFQIPTASMSLFTSASLALTIILYDRVFVPWVRKFTGLQRGLSFLQRMGIGLVISTMATLVAGFVEVKRRHVAIAHGMMESLGMVPMSFWWLAPQYCLHGMAEAFMAIGQLEFFYDQAPESMRSTATSMYWLGVAIGNYVSTILVSLIHKYTHWLSDRNLNKGKLEYLYWLLTGMQALNLAYFLICAHFYTRKIILLSNQGNQEDVGVDRELLTVEAPAK